MLEDVGLLIYKADEQYLLPNLYKKVKLTILSVSTASYTNCCLRSLKDAYWEAFTNLSSGYLNNKRFKYGLHHRFIVKLQFIKKNVSRIGLIG